MLMLITRPSRPDFASWPGRRALAALDALAWPAAAVVLVESSPLNAGIFGAFVLAAAGLASAQRLHRALLVNHRYRFTTGSWGGRLAAVLAFGLLLKLVL